MPNPPPSPPIPVAAPLPILAGYDFLDELGRGGMGIVYRAYDRKRQEMVAIKTLPRLDPAGLYRLKQEFRTLADVAHPNLVHFHDLLSHGEQWFLTMELVNGVGFLAHVHGSEDPLGGAIRDNSLSSAALADTVELPAGAPPPVDFDRLRDALRQLAAGVAALHERGKLHRDIKPCNVLVTPAGKVVLLDFGLAAELDRAGWHHSGEQHLAGTVAYMSPEQAASEPLSPASDWYSVGVMLYEALTNQHPFVGTPVQVLNAKRQREPPRPGSLVSGIPPDLDRLSTDLLRRAPELRPGAAEVLRRLGMGHPPQAAHSAPVRAPFIGRGPHLEILRDAFRAVCQGEQTTIFVEGRSGAGKSQLVLHFLDTLPGQVDAVVLAGKCYERESMPYKALDSLVDALSRYLRRLPTLEAQVLLPREVHLLARIFPVLQRAEAVAAAPGRAADLADPNEFRRRAFAALRELLARLSDRWPLVLFIDDLQWGDEESAAQLGELLRPPDPPRALVIGCYRSEEVPGSPCLRLLLEGTVRDPAAAPRRLAVESLTVEEARELAQTILGREDRAALDLADVIARESGGNPFFVHVLAQRLAADGCGLQAPAGELTLDRVLWARVQGLSEEARRLLEIVAVSGHPLAQCDACRAAGLAAEGPRVLSVLRSARLLRGAGPPEREEIETYHDRIRESVLAHIPEVVRRARHRSLALTLEASEEARTRPFDLAYHFDAAGDSARALPYAMAAAGQARARHALRIAEQQYRIALRGAGDDATRYHVAEGLGDVLLLAGRFEAAQEQFQVARGLAWDDDLRAHVEDKLGELAVQRHDFQGAGEAIKQALRLLGKQAPGRQPAYWLLVLWDGLVQTLHTWFPQRFQGRLPLGGAERELLAVRLYNRLAYAYWFYRGRVPCFWAQLRALNLAERYPPTPELAHACSQHALAMTMVGAFGRAVAYAVRSLTIRARLEDRWGQAQSLHMYGAVLYSASRFGECIEKCREIGKLLEETGDPWELNSARFQIASSLYRLGDLRGAVEESRRYYQSWQDLGVPHWGALVLATWAKASGGQVPQEILDAALARPPEDAQILSNIYQAQGVQLLAKGRPSEAVAMLEEGLEVVRKARLRSAYMVALYPWHATALRREAGQPDCPAGTRKALLRRARAACRQGLRLARTFRNDLPHTLREQAHLEALRGRLRSSRRLFDQGLAIAAEQGARYEYAQTLLARGQVGSECGWPGAVDDVARAQRDLAELEAGR